MLGRLGVGLGCVYLLPFSDTRKALIHKVLILVGDYIGNNPVTWISLALGKVSGWAAVVLEVILLGLFWQLINT